MSNHHTFRMERILILLASVSILVVFFGLTRALPPHIVQAAHQMESAAITVSGECVSHSTAYTIVNTGAAMTVDYTWTVTVDGSFYASESFSLGAAGTTEDKLERWFWIDGNSRMTIQDNNSIEVASATVTCFLPAATLTPSITPTPTGTPTITNTPTETSTPTMTLTPTRTPTMTPSRTVTPTTTQTSLVASTASITPMPSSTHKNTAAPENPSQPGVWKTQTSTPVMRLSPSSTLTPSATLLSSFGLSTSATDTPGSVTVTLGTAQSAGKITQEKSAEGTSLGSFLGYGVALIGLFLLVIFLRRKQG